MSGRNCEQVNMSYPERGAADCCFALSPFLSLLFVFFVPSTTTYAEVDFNRDVLPILADNCFECHGPDEESREADLRLDVLKAAIGDVIMPGNPAKSELFSRLSSEAADEVMPPSALKKTPHSKAD